MCKLSLYLKQFTSVHKPISPINHGHNMWKPPSHFPVGNYMPSTVLPSCLKWPAPSLKCQLPVCVSTRKCTSCSLIFQVKEQIETVFLFSCLGGIKKENLGEQENAKEQQKSHCLGHKALSFKTKGAALECFSLFIFFLNYFRGISYSSKCIFIILVVELDV